MKYNLHDYAIDGVSLEKDRIVFHFPDGFYIADGDGQELKPLRKKLAFLLDTENWPGDSAESFLSIRRRTRGGRGWKDISFRQFQRLFQKGNMVIHDEYDSKLTNWKMLQIHTSAKWNAIEMFITDILDVAFPE